MVNSWFKLCRQRAGNRAQTERGAMAPAIFGNALEVAR